MFPDPMGDMQISLFLFGASFIISLVIGLLRKNIFLFLLLFSVLGNISFLLNVGSLMFIFYHIAWFQYVILFVWPVINVFLFVRYFKQSSSK